MDRRLKQFTHRPIKMPFPAEEQASRAYKKLFSEKFGAKVLDQLMIEMEYTRPDLPASHEQMAFNAGKKYVINHILHALASDYELIEEENND